MTDVFRDVHRSNPEAAYRLVEGMAALPEVGSNFLGFRLLQELGRGAFARVFLAEQDELAQRWVVLKVTTQLMGEPQTLAQLQHTNIVPVYSLHQADPLYALCMPWLGGTTLADVFHGIEGLEVMPHSGKTLVSTLRDHLAATQRTRSSRPGSGGTWSDDPNRCRTGASIPSRSPAGTETASPPGEPGSSEPSRREVGTPGLTPTILENLERLTYVEAVLWIGARLAAGLEHAHERGILHRDLKPANILLTDDGQPMLLDFNLSQDTRIQTSASVAQIGGTLPYMAPEHLDTYRGGKQPVDARSDLYALGIILYELLTGQYPFPRHHGPGHAILTQMLEDRLGPAPRVRPLNAAVSPAAESIVRHCLHPDPDRRYQSAGELREDLERQLAHEPLRHAPEPSPRERVHKWLRRHPRLTSILASSTTVAVLTGVLILALIGALATHQNQVARAEARERRDTFLNESRKVQFLLNSRRPTARALDEGSQLCLAALERYRVLEGEGWQDHPAVRHLPAEERARLRGEVGELLWLLGRASLFRAENEDDSERRGEALRFALRVNELAGACGAGEPTRALTLQKADLLELQGKKSEAKELRRSARDIPLHSTRDHFLTALASFDQQETDQAAELLQAAVRQDPKDFWAWFLLANCHDKAERSADALACYTACIALWPDCHRCYFNRALVYLRDKRFRDARADLNEAIRLEPKLADLYVHRAMAAEGLRDSRAAERDLTQALELGTPETRVYFMRAVVRGKAGDAKGAAADRAEGVRREPSDEISWVARGLARMNTDPRGALADFDEALRCNKHYLPALQNKAAVLSDGLHRDEEAVRVLDRAIALHPYFVPARIGRGVLLARLGRRQAAHEDARWSLAHDATPVTCYQAANIFALTSVKEADDHREVYPLLARALRGGFGLDLLDKDSDFDPVRNQPEFKRLAEGAKSLRVVSGRAALNPSDK
jgi:serine/threonine protein kinase/tetratricopeptide (TPR) repeat protein